MTLNEFLEATGTKKCDFIRLYNEFVNNEFKLRITAQHLCNYLGGRNKPTSKRQAAIMQFTKHVTPNDWVL